MIPYLDQPALPLGIVTIHAFGVLVALAVIVGSTMARRHARKNGVPDRVIGDLLTWTIVVGFVFGHVLDSIVYFPAETLAHPVRLFVLWDGLSSFGGFVGGVLGATAFLQRKQLGALRWRALDAVAYGFPFGWIFGRLGCTLAFDHPGVATTFFLGERDIHGVVRHNLGLDEALFAIALAALFLALGRRRRHPGFFIGLLSVLYGPARAALDTLRIDDARYFGATPAQYGAIVLVLVGSVLLVRAQRREVGATSWPSQESA